MKKAIKAKWVAALRSGEYKKGAGALKTANGRYCCLGVLTDLYCKANKKGWASATRYESSVTPSVVMKWAGLKHSDPEVKTKRNGNLSLSDVNDGNSCRSGSSFTVIANLISKQL